MAKIAGPALVIALAAVLVSPLENDRRVLSPSELAEISPFLESGHERSDGGVRRFVGNLGPTWEYLGTSERMAAASEIGERLQELEIHSAALLGEGPRTMARWENGAITWLVPKPAVEP